MNNPYTHTETRNAMNLERTSLINESWKANVPTVRDLLAIEREKRNAYISAELAEMAERDYQNDYDYGIFDL